MGVDMNRNPDTETTPAQRAAAKRTAWVLGAIAVALYAAFVASGVIGR